MKISLRVRFFLWLLLLLVIFMAVQTLVYTFVEIATMAKHPEFNVREQLAEVVMGVSLNLLLLPVLAVVAWWISSRMLRPIRTLASTAGLIGDGHLDQRVDVEIMPDDEMRKLAQVLNHAFDQYQQAIGRLERFTGDASHQLRTPLASIRMTAEVALTHQGEDPAMYRDILGSILEDVAQLSHLVDQLLAMARLGRDEVRSAFKEIDLAALLQGAAEVYRPACELSGVTLFVESACGVSLRGNPDLLQEALRNLLDNALKFGADGGCLRVEVTSHGKTVEIAVMDKGPGIAEEYAEAVFQRFYRAPSPVSQGSGLGLALVRDIANLHGGSVRLDRRPGWGGVFVLRLPVV